MNVKAAMAKAEQWKKNIDFGMNWNSTTEGQLNHLNDLLTKAREIAIASIKDNSSETVAAHVQELDHILREAITVSNAKYQDRYLFSVNEPVNTLFGYTETNGEISSIINPSYIPGMADPLDISVGESTSVRVNVDGEKLFFDSNGNNILENLLALKNAVKANDSQSISDAMGQVEKAQSRVLEALTTVGATMNRLEARKDALDNVIITQQERLGDLEETDMAKLATDYQMTATTLQAIYQSTARVSNLTLLTYL
jgi:flagellar hook-associated protein 3 FlgL